MQLTNILTILALTVVGAIAAPGPPSPPPPPPKPAPPVINHQVVRLLSITQTCLNIQHLLTSPPITELLLFRCPVLLLPCQRKRKRRKRWNHLRPLHYPVQLRQHLLQQRPERRRLCCKYLLPKLSYSQSSTMYQSLARTNPHQSQFCGAATSIAVFPPLSAQTTSSSSPSSSSPAMTAATTSTANPSQTSSPSLAPQPALSNSPSSSSNRLLVLLSALAVLFV